MSRAYMLESFINTKNQSIFQICLMAIYLQPYCIEICPVTRPLTSDVILTVTNILHLISAEYERKQDLIHLKEFWCLTLQPTCEE